MARWVALLLTVLLLSSGSSRGEDTAAQVGARSEGTVVWYTTLVIDQIARPMAAAFEAKYPGIHVQYARRSNPATAGLVLMESRAGTPRADVVDGTSVLEPLEAAGLLATLPPPPGYPKELVDPEGRWAATNIYFLGAAYNTDLVKPADVPRSFEDLLDPRWTGQIAWTNDQTPNGPPGFIYDVLQTMGQEKGMAYLTALAKQQIVNIPLSQRSVLDQVISGEHKLALMTFNHHSIISAREGAPVAWIKTMPLLASISAAGVLKAAPHPNAARLFYDFMVSLDGQKVIADALYLPALPGTPTPIPEALPANGHFATVLLDPEKSRTVVPEMTKIYDQLFR